MGLYIPQFCYSSVLELPCLLHFKIAFNRKQLHLLPVPSSCRVTYEKCCNWSHQQFLKLLEEAVTSQCCDTSFFLLNVSGHKRRQRREDGNVRRRNSNVRGWQWDTENVHINLNKHGQVKNTLYTFQNHVPEDRQKINLFTYSPQPI